MAGNKPRQQNRKGTREEEDGYLSKRTQDYLWIERRQTLPIG